MPVKCGGLSTSPSTRFACSGSGRDADFFSGFEFDWRKGDGDGQRERCGKDGYESPGKLEEDEFGGMVPDECGERCEEESDGDGEDCQRCEKALNVGGRGSADKMRGSLHFPFDSLRSLRVRSR